MSAIYDCFTFKDELDLLELRLRMLDANVDYFVIVEATETFSGQPKDLVYFDNREPFSYFNDKIVHVVVDDLPRVKSRWIRERAQRNAIHRGLTAAAIDDIVVIGDVDEFVSPETMVRLRTELVEPVSLEMELFYYKFNLRCGPWNLARATRVRDAGCFDCLRRTTDLPQMSEAGWHFSYLVDPAAAVKKITDFSHTELNVFATEKHLDRCMRLQLDGSRGLRLEYVPDEHLDPIIRAFRASIPGLFADPLGPWQRLEQLLYGATVKSRRFQTAEEADRHPYRTAVRALPQRAGRIVHRFGSTQG